MTHLPYPPKYLIEKYQRLLEKSHQEHADIVHYLQNEAHPYAIPIIKQAILLKPHLAYLDYDDYDYDYN